MSKSDCKNVLPHVVAFLIVAIWGSTFAFTKLLLLSGLSPAQIFTLRFIISYVLLLLFSLCRKKHHQWWCRSWTDELLMMGLGVSGGSLYFLTENASMNYTTTTNTSLIVCSTPLLTSALVGLFYKTERLGRWQTFGSVMALAGVAVVVLNGHFVLHLSPLGDSLALAASLCWAVYSLLMIRANKGYDEVFISRKVFIYGLLSMIPYYIYVPEWPDMSVLLRADIVGNLLFLGVVASMLCFILWAWVINHLGAVVATNYVYVSPVTSVFFAWWILSEPITPFFLIGGMLILLGMYLADRKPNRS